MNQNGIFRSTKLLFMGLVFFVVGLGVVFGFALPTIKMAKASADWPKTTGVVEVSSVEEIQRSDGHHKNSTSKMSRNSRRRRKSTVTHYRPEVSFKYSVDGRDFSSSQIRLGGSSSYDDAAVADEMVDKYPVNSSVEVYYDPATPSTAVLEPGLTTSTYFPLIGGVVFVAVGLLMSGIPGIGLLFAMCAIGSSVTASSNERQPPARQPSVPSNDRNSFDHANMPGVAGRDVGANSNHSGDGFTIQ